MKTCKTWDAIIIANKALLFHLSPLTSEVVGAPQMALQQYLSTISYLPLPTGNLHTPFQSISWCYLPISSSVFLSFLILHCPLQSRLRHARGSWDVAIPSECPFLYCCEPPRRHMVIVGNIQKSPIESHLKGLDPSLDLCCQGPALTGIKEGR